MIKKITMTVSIHKTNQYKKCFWLQLINFLSDPNITYQNSSARVYLCCKYELKHAVNETIQIIYLVYYYYQKSAVVVVVIIVIGVVEITSTYCNYCLSLLQHSKLYFMPQLCEWLMASQWYFSKSHGFLHQ